MRMCFLKHIAALRVARGRTMLCMPGPDTSCLDHNMVFRDLLIAYDGRCKTN